MVFLRVFNRKGQSVAEYATLFAIIIGAVVAMQLYVKRALQARQRDSMVHMMRNALGMGGGDKFQYEPYYQTKNINQQLMQNSQTVLDTNMNALSNQFSHIEYGAGSFEEQEGDNALGNY